MAWANSFAEKTIKQMVRNGHPVKDKPIIVLGLTFGRLP